jgi:predicted ArsR family transcriptional regulator
MRRQLEVLRAYIAAGSIAAAAHELGITEKTARQHLTGLYRRTGCLNAAQEAYLLGKTELVCPPKGLAARRKGAGDPVVHPACASQRPLGIKT